MKGRKTKYTPERIQKICDLIQEDTYTIPEICERVGISVTTFHDWKSKKTDFSNVIKKAEDTRLKNFNREANFSMLKKLKGYDYEEKKIVYKNIEIGKDGKGHKIFKAIKVEETTTTKHIAPSDTMIIFVKKSLDKNNFGENNEGLYNKKVVVVKDGIISFE